MPGTHPAIASAYDQLAERWTDAHFHPQNGLAQHRRALAFLGDAKPGGWALNVGCGCNTRFNDLLRSHGLALEGLDLSARMLALARAADPDVVLHQADVCSWQPARRYRFIAGWDSLWHVPLDQQHAVLLKLLQALEPGGVILFTAGGLDVPGEHWDDTMGLPVYYATPGIPGLLAVLGETGCVCRHLEFDQHPQSHLCVIAQRPAAVVEVRPAASSSVGRAPAPGDQSGG